MMTLFPEASTTRILITGGTGFVGQAIVEAMASAGYSVIILSRKAPKERSHVRYLQHDLLTLDAARARLLLIEHQIDVVVHCAGEVSDPARMRALHVDATARLAEAAADTAAHWIQISSVGALGSGGLGEQSPERRTPPVGEYESTKAESDDVVSAALRGSRTVLTVLMPTIVFAPDMPSTALRKLVTAVKSGRFINVGPPDAGAHYLFVTDLAEAAVQALRARPAGSYVISDSTTVGELIQAISAEVGVIPPARRVPEPFVRAALSPRLGAIPLPGRNALRALRNPSSYSPGPAAADMGWTATAGWRRGLSRCIEEWGLSHERAGNSRPLRISYLTTVPITLHFFRGHIAHEKALGSDITVMADPSGGDLVTTARKFGVRPVGIPLTRKISPAADARALLTLIRVLRSARPDVLQTATPKAGLLGAIAGRATRTPLVVTGVFGLPQMTASGWKKALLDATIRTSTYGGHITWCDSPSMAQHVRDSRLAPPPSVGVVGHGSVSGVDSEVDFAPDRYRDDRTELRRTMGVAPEAPVIGFVGRLARDKGMTELAEAWNSLRQRHPQAHLLLVGPDDGDLVGVSRRLLEASPRLHWVGPQFPVARWFAPIDIFVMPSYREGFCATNLEASSMGIPIVATRIPGCVDSVSDGVTGTLVPARDSSALAAAISAYIDNPTLAARHGRAGRHRAQSDFAPKNLEDELARLYRWNLVPDERSG